MELDGTPVHLKAGDVLVQRGTIHNWVNKGSEPCQIAFALVDARPVKAGGKTLNAEGVLSNNTSSSTGPSAEPSASNFSASRLPRKPHPPVITMRIASHPMPYFLAQPRPARVWPLGRYSQPIQP